MLITLGPEKRGDQSRWRVCFGELPDRAKCGDTVVAGADPPDRKLDHAAESMGRVVADTSDRVYQDSGFDFSLQMVDRLEGDAEDPHKSMCLRPAVLMRQIEGVVSELPAYPHRFRRPWQQFPLFWWPRHRADARQRRRTSGAQKVIFLHRESSIFVKKGRWSQRSAPQVWGSSPSVKQWSDIGLGDRGCAARDRRR